MTLLQNKTQEILVKGRRNRRNWNRDHDGIDVRIYNWWAAHGGKPRETENLCHYFWVVVLFAPVRWATQPLRTRAGKITLRVIATLLILAVLLWVTTRYFSVVSGLAIGIGTLAYFIFGLGLIKHFSRALVKESKLPVWLDKGYGFVSLLALIWFPMLAVATLILLVFGVIASLFDEHKIHRHIFYSHPFKIRGLQWMTPFLTVCFLMLLFLITTSPFNPVSLAIVLFILKTALVVCVGLGLLVGGAVLSDRAKEKAKAKRAEAERKAAAGKELTAQLINEWRREKNLVLLRELFNGLHPKQRTSQFNFEAWLARYSRWMGMRQGHWSLWNVNDLLTQSPRYLVGMLTTKEVELISRSVLYSPLPVRLTRFDEEYRLRFGDPDGTAKRKKSRRRPIRTTLKVIGSFLSLVWAFVLTKKWGICPTITLPR